ncbi:MAG: hypothetical protein JSR58_04895 [Verrucomicrobia bacterium]|nr:hypothetical protein [Verrucomicrobiota bacterium]
MSRLLIVLVVILCACSSRTYQKSEYVSSQFAQDKLAVIVFKMRGKANFIGAAPKVTFDLVRINKEIGVADGKFIYNFSPGFFGKLNVWGKDYLCLMIEPGFYIIDNISWTEGNVNYFTPKGALPMANPVQYAAFEVKPGTVNYLGDLEVYCHQALLGINRVNEFDKAKASLEKNHPELAPYLTHADFLPAGYCLSVQ